MYRHLIMNNSDVYEGCKEMTYGDARHAQSINRKNDYGISYAQLKALCTRHEKARKINDIRTMEKIEYRLTDINFHYECGMMHHGEYEKLREELNKH